MKYNKAVSRSTRKNRRRFFNAPSHIRRKIMSVAVSKAVCREYGVPRLTLPIRRDDVVKVVRGKYKNETPAKVMRVQRRKYRIFIDNIQREKVNGASVKVPIHYSNVIITKLKTDHYRTRLIKKKVQNKLKARKRLGLEPGGVKKEAKETKEKQPKAEKPQTDLD